ncbi:CLUMA_CG013238, isoform A [Clunio marinus]|uniref:CLUMA_CG013238, isoform A n=1 Tax=Clunio marinus TaxID=568069 RepID=A0A1J1IIA0_9DIPT|nr:CLUMA_CG013238, isoform A [Clunio marinus]
MFSKSFKKPGNILTLILVINIVQCSVSEKVPDKNETTTLSTTLSTGIADALANISTNVKENVKNQAESDSNVLSSAFVGDLVTTSKPKPTEAFMRNTSALAHFDGEITESFMKKINPHWLKFPAPSQGVFYFLAFIYFIMTLVGLSGNVLVIYIYYNYSNQICLIICRCSSVRTPANNFILNLAISDFIILLEAPIFIYNALHFGPATGELAIMTLCVISLDRYNVIVYPLNPSRSTTNMRSRIMILFVWIYSLPFAFIPFFELFGVSGYIPEGYLTCCSFDYLSTTSANYWFIFFYAIIAFFVPLTVIAYCYFHILNVVLSAKKIQSSKEKNKQEVKLAVIVMGIVGLWCFAWTPYCVVSLVGIFGYGDSISPIASMIPAIMAKIACCGDPYLYAVTHPRFRAEIEKMFCSSDGNFASSYRASRKKDKVESECETVQFEEDTKKKRPLQRAESSVCEESTID